LVFGERVLGVVEGGGGALTMVAMFFFLMCINMSMRVLIGDAFSGMYDFFSAF